jgi:hypothetical protein
MLIVGVTLTLLQDGNQDQQQQLQDQVKQQQQQEQEEQFRSARAVLEAFAQARVREGVGFRCQV